MVTLGSKNSRMRDFFDIRALARAESFDGERLARAIRTTFDRRETRVPNEVLVLTPGFAKLDGRGDQWNGFLRKNGLPQEEFAPVIDEVARFSHSRDLDDRGFRHLRQGMGTGRAVVVSDVLRPQSRRTRPDSEEVGERRVDPLRCSTILGVDAKGRSSAVIASADRRRDGEGIW
jgi:hypothetical protein